MRLIPKQIASCIDSVCAPVITHMAPVSIMPPAYVFPGAQFLLPQDTFLHQSKLSALSFFLIGIGGT